VTPQFSLTPDDLHTPITVNRIDDELINRVRIDGGTDAALDDAQPTQNGTVRVDDSNRRIFQVQTRKSELDSIEIFTDPDPNANDGVVVRLQAARNGQAVAPNEPESDIAQRELAPSFLASSDFTEFKLPDHDLAPGEDPFVIVEGAGSTGHDIGVDTNTSPNEVAYRAFFPFPLIARIADGQSVSEFRRRDLRRRDDQLENEQAVEDAVQSVLRHRTEPKRRLSASAATPRAHQLRPGQAVSVTDIPVSDVSGDYIVTERGTEFQGTQLRTDLTLEDADTI
jgi:hypothetical protein